MHHRWAVVCDLPAPPLYLLQQLAGHWFHQCLADRIQRAIALGQLLLRDVRLQWWEWDGPPQVPKANLLRQYNLLLPWPHKIWYCKEDAAFQTSHMYHWPHSYVVGDEEIFIRGWEDEDLHIYSVKMWLSSFIILKTSKHKEIVGKHNVNCVCYWFHLARYYYKKRQMSSVKHSGKQDLWLCIIGKVNCFEILTVRATLTRHSETKALKISQVTI